MITQATTLIAQNQDYTIKADVDEKAQLPKDTTLTVKEIKNDDAAYQANYEKVQNSLVGKNIESVLLYDISFESNGQKVEPKADVKVTITPSEAMAAKDNFDVIHFPDDGSQENITQKDVKEIDHKITSVSFENSKFSAYALVTSSNPKDDKATDDAKLQAKNTPRSVTTHTVTFKYTDNSGVEHDMTTAEVTDGGTIAVFPTPVYREGYRFTRWKNQADDSSVTEDTTITSDMTVMAQYVPVSIYNITINYYYYNNETHQNVVFNQEIHQIEGSDTPFRVDSPSSTTPHDPTLTPGTVYYPSQSIVELADESVLQSKDASDGVVDGNITIDIQYVAYTARYKVHYMLKNINDGDYTEIEEVESYGVLGSTIRPQVLVYDYADFERTDSVTLTEAQGQNLYVYYTRKNYTLSYNSTGGSYIAPVEGHYGETISLASTTPTKEGYTFDGWYDNPELTGNVISGDVVLNQNKTLYAKWQADTVSYTIAYYKEVYDNSTNTSHYAYDSSNVASGEVGTTVFATDALGLSSVPKGYERESAYNKNSTSSVVIRPDGSSVLKVYYRENEVVKE